MSKLLRSVSYLSVAALVSLGLSGCKKHRRTGNAPTGDVIHVGEVESLTGSEATFGTTTHAGIMLAVDQINSAGGIKGKKIAITTLDDQGKPEEAAMAVQKLVSEVGVSAILGEVASSRSIAMAPIAQSNHVPMITPSSTDVKVTQAGDFVFRVCFISPFQGNVMARFAAQTLHLKRVAILRDIKNDYSVGLAKYFKQTFEKLGGKIVADQSYSAGDIDFKSQLTAIRATNPDAIFVPGYYTEVGLIGRQTRELGIQAPLLGGDGWDSPKLTQIGGKAINGSYFVTHYSQEDQSPYVQNFISKFKAANHGEVPNGLAAMGYDAMMVLADAMKRAPDLKNTSIRDALATTQNYQAVTGKITIDSNRNARKSAVVLKVENGKFKYQTTVPPEI